MLTGYSSENKSGLEENEEALLETSGNHKDWITVEPAQFVSSFDLRGIWNYRELLYFLSLRDIKIRYKQTLLGIAWVVLQPVITTVIFTTIFFRLGTSQNLAIPYPLFTFSGFVLWTFISSAIQNCSNSLVNHSSLITKVYFPRLIIPFSAAIATLLDLIFGLITLFAVTLVYKIVPSINSIFIIFLIIPTVFLALGIGIISAALNVKYRDVKYILPFVIQIFFFISPVFYSLSILPEESLWIWKLNPVTGILENFRALLFGLPFDWTSFGLSSAISVAIFVLAVFVFHRLEDDFADVI